MGPSKLCPAATAALMALTAGCGSSGGTTSDGAAALFPGCRPGTAAVRHAAPLARADLDGDGAVETLRYTGAHAGACSDALVVTVHGRTSGLRLRTGGVDPDTAAVVRPPGHEGGLVYVSGRPHPRGGFQPHLVGLASGDLAEVTTSGHPLLPFVATDGSGAPATADCTADGGIATLTASTHEPPGIVLAWDLRRTTYSLHGTRARQESTRAVDTAVADPVLRKERPELYRPTFFTHCTVGPRRAG